MTPDLLHNCSYNRNTFPQHYQGISEAQLPGELFQEAVAIEYVLHHPVRAPPAFLLVLDVSQSYEALTVWTVPPSRI